MMKALAYCAALCLGGAVHAQTLGIATMQPGTLAHTVGSSIAKVLKEKGGINALVQPTSGESMALAIVGKGDAPLGLVVGVTTCDACLVYLLESQPAHDRRGESGARRHLRAQVEPDEDHRRSQRPSRAHGLCRHARARGDVARPARDRRPDREGHPAGDGAECDPRGRRFRRGQRRCLSLRVRRAKGARSRRHGGRHPRARDPGAAGHRRRAPAFALRLSQRSAARAGVRRHRAADQGLHVRPDALHAQRGVR